MALSENRVIFHWLLIIFPQQEMVSSLPSPHQASSLPTELCTLHLEQETGEIISVSDGLWTMLKHHFDGQNADQKKASLMTSMMTSPQKSYPNKWIRSNMWIVRLKHGIPFVQMTQEWRCRTTHPSSSAPGLHGRVVLLRPLVVPSCLPWPGVVGIRFLVSPNGKQPLKWPSALIGENHLEKENNGYWGIQNDH